MRLNTLDPDNRRNHLEDDKPESDEPTRGEMRLEDYEWPALMVAGVAGFILGVFFLFTEPGLGIIFIVLGFVFVFLAVVAHRVEGDVYVPNEIDREWREKMDREAVKQDFESRSLHRQRDKDDIVKAVKSTIKMRCRYCGTLNDEGANKCESCGGVL